jgi:hypothetical protein
MARSAGALNPASIPFFPGGGIRASSDDEAGISVNGGTAPTLGFHVPNLRQQEDRNSMSTLSISPSEFRSVRSSPSPSSLEEHIDRDRDRERGRDSRDNHHFQPSPSPGIGARGSPAFRQVEADRPYPNIESRPRETSTMGSLETLPEDTPQPSLSDSLSQVTSSGSPFFSGMVQGGREQRHSTSTPPVTANNSSSRSSSFNANSFNTNGAFTSSSPVSSLDSGSQFAPSSDHSLEAQLKALPLIHDILDRLVRCEYSTREIQRDLGDVHRKVNILVERSYNANNNAIINSQPEFKDPFAPSNPNVQQFSSPASNGPRGSMGAIAPNQISSSDDIGQISQRLNTLTASVGQLLALQTQQHIQSTNPGFSNGQMGGSNQHQQQDLAPNQMLSPPSQPGVMGHGLPNRPDMRGPPVRTPNPPMRTWSAGNLDLPMRPSDSGSLGRSNDINNKRRSVTGGAISGAGLMRRESAGVRTQSTFCYYSLILPEFSRFLIRKAKTGLGVHPETMVPWCQSGSSCR